MAREHRIWALLLRAWRRFPWPRQRGRDRVKDLLVARVRAPRPVPTGAGWLLLEHGDDSLERHLLTTGTHWETRVVTLLEASRGALGGTSVLSVGGHVGFYAVLLARMVGPRGRVVAVEAQADLCRRIEWARERNRVPWLDVVNAAASDRAGPVTFGLDPDRGHATVATGTGRTVTVDGVRLDDWASDHGLTGVRLVMMDIEGGEAAALRGMEQLLRRSRPDLLVEVHPAQLAALGTSQEALLAWIRDLGPYELAVVDHHEGTSPLVEPPTAASWHLLARDPTRSGA